MTFNMDVNGSCVHYCCVWSAFGSERSQFGIRRPARGFAPSFQSKMATTDLVGDAANTDIGRNHDNRGQDGLLRGRR